MATIFLPDDCVWRVSGKISELLPVELCITIICTAMLQANYTWFLF